MSNYKVDQRHINHRGRVFHFVSYEAQPANARTDTPAVEASWFLMGPGRRWQVMPQTANQLPEETDRCLREWLEQNMDS